MKYLICGGSGFIGRELTEYWLQGGHQIIVVGRKQPEARTAAHPALSFLTWDSLASHPELAYGADALVNLAGSSLSQRWSPSGKKSIMQSRLETVSAAARLLNALQNKPPVVIQSSAIAIYGTSLEDTYDETSPAQVMDFPSGVVEAWEGAADEAYKGVRVVKLRTGVVLGNESGAFPKMKLPYMLGFGGKIGSGKQWLSWISLTDIVRLIDFCVQTPGIEGPVNATAPHPVTNEAFGKMIGRVYHRPHWFPIPAFLLKTAVGELSEILLKGQRVLPSKALEHGFTFTYPTLQPALEHLKGE
ncbi:TIGR01777 family oxidoreductase [Paenibacillus riograndensis]|uniref:Epimerase family protein YfhF n=1 Tax=Paenibacillus riograndensis SBR5 TaxID=1073571 RepID=A0A0E4H7J0_9BACL|nr:TIGR01777 family oxidoreductase [Paenibacillus riograndensis]CQR53626.1 Epimerase family protein YfhF [Paenibacillus riograndensis SBR5]